MGVNVFGGKGLGVVLIDCLGVVVIYFDKFLKQKLIGIYNCLQLQIYISIKGDNVLNFLFLFFRYCVLYRKWF